MRIIVGLVLLALITVALSQPTGLVDQQRFVGIQFYSLLSALSCSSFAELFTPSAVIGVGYNGTYTPSMLCNEIIGASYTIGTFQAHSTPSNVLVDESGNVAIQTRLSGVATPEGCLVDYPAVAVLQLQPSGTNSFLISSAKIHYNAADVNKQFACGA